MFKKAVMLLLVATAATGAWALQESEPNSSTSDANVFTVPDTLTGMFSNDGSDVHSDFFRFNAASNTTYRFVATVSDQLDPIDVGLKLYSAGGSLIKTADDNGMHGSETLEFTTPGMLTVPTMYLEVYEATGYASGISSYSVNASVTAGVNDWSIY